MPTGLARLLSGGRHTRGENSSKAAVDAAAVALAAATQAQADAQGEEEEEEASAEGAEAETAAETEAESEASEASDAQDEEDEEEPERPMAEEDAEAQAGRLRERARISRILRSDAASGREAAAQALALETDLPSDQAVKVLGTTPKSTKGKLAQHMADVPQPSLGPGGDGVRGEDTVQQASDRLAAYVQPRR